MDTIKTQSIPYYKPIKELTSHAIDLLEQKHSKKKGWRRLPVENYLLSIDNTMLYSDCISNLSLDAAAYKWKSPIITAIRQGIDHLFHSKKI